MKNMVCLNGGPRLSNRASLPRIELVLFRDDSDLVLHEVKSAAAVSKPALCAAVHTVLGLLTEYYST
jgi:hypothetical protein